MSLPNRRSSASDAPLPGSSSSTLIDSLVKSDEAFVRVLGNDQLDWV